MFLVMKSPNLLACFIYYVYYPPPTVSCVLLYDATFSVSYGKIGLPKHSRSRNEYFDPLDPTTHTEAENDLNKQYPQIFCLLPSKLNPEWAHNKPK